MLRERLAYPWRLARPAPARSALAVLLAATALLSAPSVAQDRQPAEDKLRIITFGAHPDDCELEAGGVAAKWAALGHSQVRLRDQRRHRPLPSWPAVRWPCAVASEVAGGRAHPGHRDGGPRHPRRRADATLENRRRIARLIREWKADVVISHRPNDYHPDHRYTGVLVQDAAYMVTVPVLLPRRAAPEAQPGLPLLRGPLPEAEPLHRRHRGRHRRRDREEAGRGGGDGVAVLRGRLLRRAARRTAQGRGRRGRAKEGRCATALPRASPPLRSGSATRLAEPGTGRSEARRSSTPRRSRSANTAASRTRPRSSGCSRSFPEGVETLGRAIPHY